MRKTVQFLAMAALLLFISTGCRSQVPTTQPKAAFLSWNAPVPATIPPPAGTWQGCGTPSTCAFGVYAESVATATTPCDPVTSANYKQVGTTAAGVTAYQDATPGFRCFVVATLQSGNVSAPSNSAFVNVPPLPLAPGTLTTTVQTAELLTKPALPQPGTAKAAYQLAANASPMNLRVEVR
jgi:hypothetical protein